MSQLGLKIQHALRAFTATDRKAIKLTAENYPISEFYKTDEIITQLGTGEALITALNEKGIPTPLAATMLRAPMSRMDILTDEEINTINSNSRLVKKYSEQLDRESACEILTKKIESITAQQQHEAHRQATRTSTTRTSTGSTLERQILKTVTSATFMRGVFGVLNKMFK